MPMDTACVILTVLTEKWKVLDVSGEHRREVLAPVLPPIAIC